MAETIRFRYTPTPGDYSRVMRAHSLRTRGVWLSLAAIVVLMLVFLGSSLARGEGIGLPGGVFMIGVPLFAALAVFVWQPLRAGRAVQKQEQFRSETAWQVDPSQIVIGNAYAETTLSWETFGQVLETPDDFHLIYAANRRQLQFVPKRAFESPVQEEAFRALLRSKLRVVKWI